MCRGGSLVPGAIEHAVDAPVNHMMPGGYKSNNPFYTVFQDTAKDETRLNVALPSRAPKLAHRTEPRIFSFGQPAALMLPKMPLRSMLRHNHEAGWLGQL